MATEDARWLDGSGVAPKMHAVALGKATEISRQFPLAVPSDSLKWKWNLAFGKTLLLYKQGGFHFHIFHVSESECDGTDSAHHSASATLTYMRAQTWRALHAECCKWVYIYILYIYCNIPGSSNGCPMVSNRLPYLQVSIGHLLENRE